MQVMLMRLMSKGEYVIVPKGTKFTGSGKLGLMQETLYDWRERGRKSVLAGDALLMGEG